MRKTNTRIRLAASLLAASIVASNTPVVLNAEESYQFEGQALVDECGYYVKVIVNTDKEGRVLSISDNGTESPKSSEHFWNIFAENKDDYFSQYHNKSVSEIADMEVDAVSGATKSSQAAHEAVKCALDKYKPVEDENDTNPNDEPEDEPTDRPSTEETMEDEQNENPSEEIENEADFEIDEDGVLKEYCGSESVAVIPEGVVEIDEYSFSAAENLQQVNIPSSVEYINPQSFLNCPNLTKFVVDEGNKYFYSKDGAIYAKNSSDITKLVLVPCGLKGAYTIEDDVDVIGESAFYSTYLSVINISKSVSSIDPAMIDHAVELKELNVVEENSNFSSADGLLYNKSKDELILVPTGVEGELHVADGVNHIGEGAFYSCVNLTSVTLPEGVTEIPMLAFAGCTSLKDVKMPESITAIGDRAFAGTGSLTSLTIPKNVSEFGQYVFANSTGMKNIYVEDGSKYFASIGGVLFSADKKTLVQYPVGRTGNYTVPDGTTCIGMGSFFAANFIEKVIIPDSVVTFGNPEFPNPILGSIVFGYFNYPRNLVLVAAKNSAAEAYAKELEINFEELLEESEDNSSESEIETQVDEEIKKEDKNETVDSNATTEESESVSTVNTASLSSMHTENQSKESSSSKDSELPEADYTNTVIIAQNKVAPINTEDKENKITENADEINNNIDFVKQKYEQESTRIASDEVKQIADTESDENTLESDSSIPESAIESTESGKTPDKIEEEQVPAAVTEDTTDAANNTGLIVIIIACVVIAVSVISVVIKHKKS